MIKLNKKSINELKNSIDLKHKEYYIVKGNSRLKTKKEVLNALLNENILKIKEITKWMLKD